MDLVIGLTVVVAVEEEECEGEGEPDGDEAHLLLALRQPHVECVEAGEGPHGAAHEAQHHGVPLNLKGKKGRVLI